MAGQDGDGGKPSSLEWQHVTSTKLLHGHSISCNYCHAKFSGGATRIRDHMCRCAAAPNAVKLLFGTRNVDAKEKATAAKAKRTLNFNTGATGARSPTVTDSLADIVQLLSPSTGAAGRALIQFAHYKAQHNIFSRPIVQNAAKELPGYLFWETYGKGYPDLQFVATRLLAQPASSSAAEQNFSKYGFILSKRRNRLTTSRASMLVFNFSNSRLLRRTQQLDADRHPVPWSDSEASNSAANSEECSGSDANDEAEA
ncbi:hypothetical protein QJQ45_026434 [Haematococcus lacustris]|nr:hypothetical protein QJQ45_026434 [Haematococcus lacustris]